MGLLRRLTILCPLCGVAGSYLLEPEEGYPTISLITCNAEEGGCNTRFAVEVRVTVQIEYSTCRLTLPSTTPVDCLKETLPSPRDPNDF